MRRIDLDGALGLTKRICGTLRIERITSGQVRGNCITIGRSLFARSPGGAYFFTCGQIDLGNSIGKHD